MKLRIAAAQINSTGSVPENLDRIAGSVRLAKRRNADAVLFPECAITGYNIDFSKIDRVEIRSALEKIGRLACNHGINILVGSPFFCGRKLYNGLVVFNRSGVPVFAIAKCQLTEADRKVFTPGNAVSLFEIDSVPATSIICHERRYPELVRIPAMAGAQIVFHPNAGLDTLTVSRRKRNGNDGISARAFENGIFYVFANTVGPQGKRRWSAGDSKIVSPGERTLAFAGNESESVIAANLDLSEAHRRYALDSLEHPAFLKSTWKNTVRLARRQAKEESDRLLSGIF